MMDDLQQAYAAYQNALINLANPKVDPITYLILSSLTLNRNLNFGTVLVFCTIGTGLSTMPKRLSLKSCKCNRTLRKQMRYTFDLV